MVVKGSKKSEVQTKINGGKAQVKRLTPVQFPKTEAAVKMWFAENRDNDVAIDGAMYRFKAVQFSKKLGEDKVMGSPGRAIESAITFKMCHISARFMRRCHISARINSLILQNERELAIFNKISAKTMIFFTVLT